MITGDDILAAEAACHVATEDDLGRARPSSADACP